MRELVRLATKAQSEQARIAAIREILDRGYGRPGEAREEPNPPQQEGMGFEPFRKRNEDKQVAKGPIRLEDFGLANFSLSGKARSCGFSDDAR
jgi:hypothetical protein